MRQPRDLILPTNHRGLTPASERSFGGVREPLQLCRKGRLRRIPPYGTFGANCWRSGGRHDQCGGTNAPLYEGIF